VAWRSGIALCPINEIASHRAGSLLGWVIVRTGKQYRYVTSRLGQLSLSSLRAR